MKYSEIYVKRILSLCKEHGISINKLANMSDVKQRRSIRTRLK